jgi:hypothetical protein
MKLRSDYGVKRGSRGAYDYNEQERRDAIRAPFREAIAKKDTRLFWKAIDCAGRRHDDPQVLEWYEKFRELIGEIPSRKPSKP